jgi:cation transport protein ChaC
VYGRQGPTATAERDKPLMMALDRGGVCIGMAYRLTRDTVEASLGKLFRREMTANPPPHRWLTVRTAEGPLRAIGFVMDRSSSRYIGGMAPEKVAEVLTKAAGHWGSGAEYLYSTVQHLETLGIHDRHLWQLQKLVAEQIRTLTSGDPEPK